MIAESETASFKFFPGTIFFSVPTTLKAVMKRYKWISSAKGNEQKTIFYRSPSA